MLASSTVLKNNSKLKKALAAWTARECFPHAILIEGEPGSGRRAVAELIAKSIFCEGETKPCGNCKHCVKIDKTIHPDLLFYDSEGGAKSFHVDKVRELRKESWVKANDGEFKAFILNNADDMTVSAQNALLKIIEEPPKKVYFILICRNKNNMLTTIRSRVTTLSTELLDNDTIIALLKKENPGCSESEYKAAVALCGTNLGMAKLYLESPEVKESYDNANSLWTTFKKGDSIGALAKVALLERNKQGFLKQLEIIRQFATKELLEISAKRGAELSLLQLTKIIDIIDEIIVCINYNVNMLLLTTVFVDKINRIINN